MDDSSQVTVLLQAWRRGDASAYDQLMPFVYAEMRRLARGQLRHERAGHSFQPTQLVHEAYLRLVKADVDWQDRTHFMRIAARAMRQILVEHARARHTRKRGRDEQFVTLTEPVAAPDTHPIDVLFLNDAMERLHAFDPREAQIVELCYFGGLTYPEIAGTLDISEATVHRALRHARAWLKAELSGEQPVIGRGDAHARGEPRP